MKHSKGQELVSASKLMCGIRILPTKASLIEGATIGAVEMNNP